MTIPLLGGHWSNGAHNAGCTGMYRDLTPGVRQSKRKGAWRIDETTQADGLVVRRTSDICSLTARIFDAVADRLLVKHPVRCNTYVLEEPPWLFSESTFPLS
jgi:hypothetical protein